MFQVTLYSTKCFDAGQYEEQEASLHSTDLTGDYASALQEKT
ncbi:hypothetical protein CSC43_4143 [Pseudomonas aeruginosa]|nr:hypothetical protein CSC43_4143 [Pseudomonas aeruginosa]